MKANLRHLTIALTALALSALNLPLSTAFAQGSLTPPGAPAPTMKSLDQVEARTPISSLPYTIASPGSYYVTTNLNDATGSDGIDINANNVTLDLNGFTLLGVGGNNTVAGINVLSPARNLVIRNGVLDSWGGTGVNATNSSESQFEGLRIYYCNIRLIGNLGGLSAGSNCVVSFCTGFANIGIGISVGNNCTVKDCNASANGVHGIAAGNNCIVKDCNAGANHLQGLVAGNNCIILGCIGSGNAESAIDASNNCTVKECNTSANTQDGIMVAGGCAVIGCTTSSNGIDGVFTAGNNCTVKDCTASANTFDGIYVEGNNCQITGNNCSGNNQHGIEIEGYPNRIDDNNVAFNRVYGIYASSTNVTNSITRNSAPGNGAGGYLNYPNNPDYAPIGTPGTSTNPWQNFQ